jgi:hypothetical protein
MKVVKNHIKSLKLSKFTLSAVQQSAANSVERLKSYGPKITVFGRFCQK